jgi:hypothetical protein
MAHPEIKARTGSVFLFAHVPFANIGRFITDFLKSARIAGEVFGIIGEIVKDTVAVSIQAAEKGSAAGRA